MKLSAIVATDRRGTIGKDGDIPWYLPGDLQFFKRTTLGHPVIMGRKTFRSIGTPLPKRTNLVMTRDAFFTGTGIIVVHSLREALAHPAVTEAPETFIVGGEEIYRQSLDLVSTVYLTIVDADIEDGDAFFPKLDPADWEEVWSEGHQPDAKNELAYRFSRWERRRD
ncbi:dihydrofolate reductase [Neolewinella lacunae]|uniref:Dihydrofolate reductase n=1 Tax=Neolewinella lacunae TaxID=1517758 RepID=A0A923T9J2_9BACT|nr:dihydrofolate reductase [Neolewinella lacunae]MBC6995621.1 dihydrofolate reductase [Neolewinella lacunae]MDN3635657.1 dihydrofolate reductase [Neolewinella lacunae]